MVLIVIRLTNNNQPQPLELNQKAIAQYELQEKNLISLNSLENNPKIHSFFADLLRNYAKKFAENKNLDISRLPLVFEGLYYDQNIGKLRS